MQLVCITDLHGRMESLQRILADAGKPDAVLLGGDITSFGSPADAERMVVAVQREVPTVLAVAGNCDSAAIDHRLRDLGVALHGRAFVRGDVGIHGLSAIPPWKRGMYQLTEEEIESALQRGYADMEGARQHVVLAHVPPRGTNADRTFFRICAGSAALRAFVDRTQPALVFCGHIHEARGVETAGKTVVVNCGFGGQGDYAVAQVTDDGVQVSLRSARG
jgi:Icc-related predicted phosphoesterase